MLPVWGQMYRLYYSRIETHPSSYELSIICCHDNHPDFANSQLQRLQYLGKKHTTVRQIRPTETNEKARITHKNLMLFPFRALHACMLLQTKLTQCFAISSSFQKKMHFCNVNAQLSRVFPPFFSSSALRYLTKNETTEFCRNHFLQVCKRHQECQKRSFCKAAAATSTPGVLRHVPLVLMALSAHTFVTTVSHPQSKPKMHSPKSSPVTKKKVYSPANCLHCTLLS